MSRITLAHKFFHPHHQYQLGVLFFFVLGIILLFPYSYWMKNHGLDHTSAQWYLMLPLSLLYLLFSLFLRYRVTTSERIAPNKIHVVSWVLLGIFLIFYHAAPIDLERLYSIDLYFTIFSIFLADAYWDFTSIPYRS